MPVNMRRDARSQRQRLIRLDRELSEDDLADRALVHALVQADWYRASMRRTRVRYLTLEAGSLLLAGAATVLAALSAPAWLTATTAALFTFLAGLRRVVSWHDDWLAASEAWARATSLIARYRLLPAAERSPEKQQELVATIDDLVISETRSWGRRRREKAAAPAPA
jgi:hypothetical protein